MNCLCLTQGYADGRYVLPPLPYSEAALEPLMDEETLMLHHDRHHAAYVAGANAAQDTLRCIAAGEIAPAMAPAAAQSLAFNLGGHILHCLYWENMSPEPKAAPGGELADTINASFGSFPDMIRIFTSVATAVQGSGWGALGIDPVSRKLLITGICRHQDVLVPGFVPLMVCDVWEHAYYLKYHNNRVGYVDAFLKMADWSVAEQRYRNSLS